MYCIKCGKEAGEGVKFCSSCGSSEFAEKEVYQEEEVTEKPSVLSHRSSGLFGLLTGYEVHDDKEGKEEDYKEEHFKEMSDNRYHKVFIDPDEQLLGRLGNGYLENLLNKKLKKCNALLTDKRVYFQGSFFSGSGKTLKQDIVEKIVDLEDITGTGFKYAKPLGILTTIITLLIPWFLAILVGELVGNDESLQVGMFGTIIAIIIINIRYIKNRKTNFILEYAGGCICFDAMIVGLSKAKDFQKQIRRAKDRAKGK